MATDAFGRTINPGDTVWIAAKVTNISAGVLSLDYTNADNSHSSLTSLSGATSQVTNPDEGDRPPR